MNTMCRKCQNQLNLENWAPSNQKRKSYICKLCESIDKKIKYLKNPSIHIDRARKNRKNTRFVVLNYYGSKCQLCGENNLNLLSLDHIDGNGRQHRKEVLGGVDSGTGFYKWVLNNKPDNIRLLCYNCNCQINMTKTIFIEQETYNKESCKYCNNLRAHHRSICSECKTKQTRNHYIDLKLEVFSHYGCKCINCGINKIEFLTMDHINNNGSDHRREIGTQIFPWLKKNNYPSDFQILCYNCNYLKRDE